MSELGKYNTSNALGLAAKGINAAATGNYTGFANTLTNFGVNKLQDQMLKSTNGTVVGYVMNELGNLGYVNGTLSKGPILTASFAGSLVNAATTAIKSPVSFATSLAGNALGTFAGIDGEAAINNAKTAFNNVTTAPNQIANGFVGSIGSSLGSILGIEDTTQPTTPNAPTYENNPSPYTPKQYNALSEYTSSITDGNSLDIDNKYNPYKYENVSTQYSSVNTKKSDELARLSKYANYDTGEKSLMSFLNHIDNFGVLLQNNFEIYFSGIPSMTLFVMNFNIGGSKLNTAEIYYDGIKMTIPVNYEHEHEFSITLMNDANGFIYSAIKSYIELDSYNHRTDPGTIMIIKAFTGQVPNLIYNGARIFAKGVRFISISGLTYGQNINDIQSFTVNGTLIEYSHLPTQLSQYK